MSEYLIFGDLPLQAPHVLGGLCDLGLQTGRVSHLCVLLVHALHLVQRLTEVKQGGGRVIVFEMGALIKEAPLQCSTADKDGRGRQAF